MIVDPSALLAIVFAEPDHSALARCLVGSDTRRIAAPNWLEACLLVDNRGVVHASVRLERFMRRFKIGIVPFDEKIADLARGAHQRFGKGRHPAKLNFGDCMAYATARFFGEPLLYKGNDFAQTDITPALP